MNKIPYILILFVLLMSAGVQAQVDTIQSKLPKDTVARLYDKSIKNVVVAQVPESLIPDSLKPKAFKPDPLKVVWMATILPGSGQIMNKKYWKLPIVYGGFLGFAYAISWNSGRYNSYKQAYFDIIRYSSDNSYKAIVDKNTSVVSFYQILPKGYTIPGYGGFDAYTQILNTAQNGSRRYRDLSIILSVAYYALTIVDAYVDAQLYDFDISPNLSMHVQPTLLENRYGATNTLGLQCSISLK